MNLGLLTVKGYMKFILINLFKAQKFLGVVQYSHPQNKCMFGCLPFISPYIIITSFIVT